MTLAAAILAAMMALPCPRDEPADVCQPWRVVVSEAVERAAQEATCSGYWTMPSCVPVYDGAPDEIASALVEVAYHESGLRMRIQAGDCRGPECDGVWSVKRQRWTGKHLAHSMWQLHQTPTIPGVEPLVSREKWLAVVGDEPTHVLTAARTAAKVLVRNPGAFGLDSLLGTGPRGKAARKVLADIRKAENGPRE